MATTDVSQTFGYVPVADIHIGENPRTIIDEDAQAELVQSIRENGVLLPLLVRPFADGYTLVAGQRRLLAATEAGLTTVPCYIRDEPEGDLVAAVVENVIRADLAPLEEAQAYAILVEQHGSVEAVSRLVGKSERTVQGRLRLLDLPETVRPMMGGSVTLACAENLAKIAERSPVLAELVAQDLAGDEWQADFPDDPTSVVDRVLRHSATMHAYTFGSWNDPILPNLEALWEWLSPHTRVRSAVESWPPLEDDYRAYVERTRRRDALRLTSDEVDAANAYGAAIIFTDGDTRRAYITDPEWVDEILGARLESYEPSTPEDDPRPQRTERSDDEKEQAREQREAEYRQRVEARARNLDVGAALQAWEPALTTDEVKLLGEIVLMHHGEQLAWAHRLCVEQPVQVAKSGRETVEYPRTADDRRAHAEQARAALERARNPKQALAVVLRLLIASHLADRTGLVNLDRAGTEEDPRLKTSERLDKLALKVAPASVKKHRSGDE